MNQPCPEGTRRDEARSVWTAMWVMALTMCVGSTWGVLGGWAVPVTLGVITVVAYIGALHEVRKEGR